MPHVRYRFRRAPRTGAGHEVSLNRHVISNEKTANTSEEVEQAYAKATAGLNQSFDDARLTSAIGGPNALKQVTMQKQVHLPKKFWDRAGLKDVDIPKKVAENRLENVAKVQKYFSQVQNLQDNDTNININIYINIDIDINININIDGV